MAKLSLAPATALDFCDVLDDGGDVKPGMRRRLFSRFGRMIDGGPSMCLRDPDGRLVLLAGLYRESEYLEAWFAVGPASPRHLRQAIRIARQVMEVAASHEAHDEVRCLISPKSVAGPRIAALFGFVHTGPQETPLGELESWTRRFRCKA